MYSKTVCDDKQHDATSKSPNQSFHSTPSTATPVPAASTNNAPQDFPSEFSGILPDLTANEMNSWNSLIGELYPSSSSSGAVPPPVATSNVTSSTTPSSSQSNLISMQPADTTVQMTTQEIVDNYLRLTMPPPHRRDFNYSFPPGLFTSEVDLEGSAQAYRHLIDGLENSSDLQQLLNQVDADPFKSTNIFNELDLDIFD